ncbi:triose-phosphate isomerase [Candidatus Kaiserbacteria bacterium]|nr:triose-phosphate isomerase [Candidatus Kaiserbacteria bacterium]
MLIVANWKAYIEEFTKAKKLFALSKRLMRITGVEIVLAPPAPLLGALAAKNKSSIAFAAQDVSFAEGGAKTGEIPAQIYETVGATYALIGHSERRATGDTDAIVRDKLAHALAHGLIPILCIGEQERDSEGRYLTVVREQLTLALESLTPRERTRVIVAYEPLWAIGKTADAAISPNDLAEMVLYIHKVLAEFLPGKNSRKTLILYGGSVEPENVRALAAVSNIDGVLVGHASIDLDMFSHLVKNLA